MTLLSLIVHILTTTQSWYLIITSHLQLFYRKKSEIFIFAVSVCYSTNIIKQWQLPADVSVLWHNCRLSIENENFSNFNSRFPVSSLTIKILNQIILSRTFWKTCVNKRWWRHDGWFVDDYWWIWFLHKSISRNFINKRQVIQSQSILFIIFIYYIIYLCKYFVLLSWLVQTRE